MVRWLKSPLTAIAVVVLAAGLFAWRWHARNSAKVSFTTAVIKRGSVVASIGATGTIEPLEVVDVGAQAGGHALGVYPRRQLE